MHVNILLKGGLKSSLRKDSVYNPPSSRIMFLAVKDLIILNVIFSYCKGGLNNTIHHIVHIYKTLILQRDLRYLHKNNTKSKSTMNGDLPGSICIECDLTIVATLVW